MASVNPNVVTFSGGIIGGELHNRVDIPTYPTGAEIMQNFRPSLQGIMSRRPPMELVAEFSDHTLEGRMFGFEFSIAASYLVQATTDGFAFYANDGLITIPVVSASVAAFTDQSTGVGAVTTIGTKVWLDSDGASDAVAEAIITTSNVNEIHVLSFEVIHGPVDIRIGTTSGDDSVMDYKRLRAGFHYLAFTPPQASVYLQFVNDDNAGRVVRDAPTILTGPTFLLPNPFAEADLREIQTQQIRDVLYMTHTDYWPRRLERRGARSWSIVKMLPDDGPFEDTNTTSLTITPSATNGEVTLTASAPLFTADDEGTLYALVQAGQEKTATATALDVTTDGIKVVGVSSTERTFTYEIAGTFVGTVVLERSSGNENNYVETSFTYTTAGAHSYGDGLQNQTWYYRLRVKAYTSGTIIMTIAYAGGTTEGVCRIVEFTSDTTAIAEVIEDKGFASTNAVTTWKRGDWNLENGFPATVQDGFARLWFGRGSKVWASASDDFTNFEAGTDADMSFAYQVATPSSDSIRWLAMLNHLIVGTGSVEKVGLGNTTSEAVGPTNWQFLPGSEEGGAAIQPITATGSVLYVHRSRKKLMQMVQNPKALSETSYISVDLTARAPDIVSGEIVGVAVQREPERRIFVVLASGKLCELLFRREGELDVVAWAEIITDGRVEDVCVLPREDQDVVYLIVRRRNAAGTWERYIERFGPERVSMDCDLYHLDSTLAYPLAKPETVATPSDTTGTITVIADADAFVVGDVGKILWISGGRGTIASYVSATEVTVTVTSELDNTDPCPKDKWGIGTPTSTLTGLDHMEGLSVRVWGDQQDLGNYTVASGAVTLNQSVSVAYAGRTYRSRWKSLKLSYGAQRGTALTMLKAVKAIGLLLYRCGNAVTFGQATAHGTKEAFSRMRPVKLRTPTTPMGEPTPLFTGEAVNAFDAKYAPDSRISIEVDGPSPATISGYIPSVDTHERAA